MKKLGILLLFCFSAVLLCSCQVIKNYDTNFAEEGIAYVEFVPNLFTSAHTKIEDLELPKYGVINENNDFVLKLEESGNIMGIYESEGLWLVRNHFLDDYGNKLIQLDGYQWTHGFSEDLAAVQKNSKWGFINKKGDLVIEPQYDDVSLGFSEGLVGVKVNNKWGFINKENQMVIEPQFDDIENTMGHCPMRYKFQNGKAAVCIGNKWGLINKEGEIVVNPEYTSIMDYTEGLAAVEKGGSWGYIDKEGTLVIPTVFSSMGYFSEGLAATRKDGVSGFINPQGEMVIVLPPEIDNGTKDNFITGSIFYEGLAAIKVGEKWGYIDRTGKLVIGAIYDDANPFDNGMAAVKVNDLYGFINPQGEFVVQPQFAAVDTHLKWYDGKYMPVMSKDNKLLWGVIDREGKMIIEPQYTNILAIRQEHFVSPQRVDPQKIY